jgi:hypothetical protein
MNQPLPRTCMTDPASHKSPVRTPFSTDFGIKGKINQAEKYISNLDSGTVFGHIFRLKNQVFEKMGDNGKVTRNRIMLKRKPMTGMISTVCAKRRA